ncbi:MAG: hypothetical protein OEW39_09040 [Deltaproteobacteria bacterium]|nr:hypothetical protein [Deltaproteobacteria bacterium]
MGEYIWKKEYERLLQKARQTGEIAEADQKEGHRSQPRFRLNHSHVWIRVPTRFDLIEVSIAGVSFLSNLNFQVGENLLLTLDRAFSVEAQVIECSLTESDSTFMEMCYRVGCAFNDLNHGMQMLVMLKEMEHHHNPSASGQD